MGRHCTEYPSPSALEACAVCKDKFRMEKVVSELMGGNVVHDETEDARRGTIIHEACAFLLDAYMRGVFNNIELDDRLLMYEKVYLEINMIKGWTEEYWNTVYNSVRAVINEIIRMRKHSMVNVHIEAVARLDSVLKGYFGTADVVLVNDNELLVADYKTGYRLVKAKNNRQLACYAYAYLNDKIEKVTFVIVQHSKNNYDRFSITKTELVELMHDNVQLIKTVTDSHIHCRKVSEKSCTYCGAKFFCGERFNALSDRLKKLATAQDGFRTADEWCDIYVTLREAGNLAEEVRPIVLKTLAIENSDRYCIKQYKDKEYIEDNNKGNLLNEISNDGLFQTFIDKGIIKNDIKIDIKKAKEFGYDIEKYEKYISRKKGNHVIVER